MIDRTLPANTIEALDASGELLARVGGVFYNLKSAETNDQIQEIARQVAPLTSALDDDIQRYGGCCCPARRIGLE
jgi:Zn-dependent oligopeptidase